MIRRIRWTRQENIKLGMEIDKLVQQSETKLIPQHELLRSLAQHILPLERRRKLDTEKAQLALARIDALRDVQETGQWLVGGVLPDFDMEADILPSDSAEVKRFAMTMRAMSAIEERILEKMQKMLDAHHSRIEALLRHTPATSAPETQIETKEERMKRTFILVYPNDAKWGSEVIAVAKALRKEHHEVHCSPLNVKTGATSVPLIDYLGTNIITVDAQTSDPKGPAARSLHKAFALQAIPFGEENFTVHNIQCPAEAQIKIRVKSLIVGSVKAA